MCLINPMVNKKKKLRNAQDNTLRFLYFTHQYVKEKKFTMIVQVMEKNS